MLRTNILKNMDASGLLTRVNGTAKFLIPNSCSRPREQSALSNDAIIDSRAVWVEMLIVRTRLLLELSQKKGPVLMPTRELERVAM
jgi:hypothetical protein